MIGARKECIGAPVGSGGASGGGWGGAPVGAELRRDPQRVVIHAPELDGVAVGVAEKHCLGTYVSMTLSLGVYEGRGLQESAQYPRQDGRDLHSVVRLQHVGKAASCGVLQDVTVPSLLADTNGCVGLQAKKYLRVREIQLLRGRWCARGGGQRHRFVVGRRITGDVPCS